MPMKDEHDSVRATFDGFKRTVYGTQGYREVRAAFESLEDEMNLNRRRDALLFEEQCQSWVGNGRRRDD